MNAVETRTRRGLLLVDDHKIVREALKRLLDPIGSEWEVVEAGTAFQALECLRLRPFEVAVVDLSMPGMTGLELIQHIKSEFPAVRMLALSMHAEQHYVLGALKAGASGYVSKDNAAAELILAVRKVVVGGPPHLATPGDMRN